MRSSKHGFRAEPFRLIRDLRFGRDVVVQSFANLYECPIEDERRIGTFVRIQRGASIGARCKIQSHSFICTGVTIGDEVFVGRGFVFINDKRPRGTSGGRLQIETDWDLLETVVENGASIGSGATILGGLRIGQAAVVGAGAVVTHDVHTGVVVAGNHAVPLWPTS